jgi:uncharacterized protein with PIN domain
MSAATETQAPAEPGRRAPRWGVIAAITAAACVAAAVIALLAVTLASQAGQLGTLRTQVGRAQAAATAAQHRADQASSAAAAAGKTQADATNANLGVCVSYGNGYAGQTVVSSPVKSPGGAVSCYSGTFTPVSPQKTPAG